MVKGLDLKRSKLLKHLKKQGAVFIREGKKHTIYGKADNLAEIPRHTEINDKLAIKICKDLEISLWK